MTNAKHTKKALFASCLSLLVCCAMLVGTTFAWFTDSASTGVNKIQAGTLDIDIVDENGISLQDKTLSFKNVNGSSDILWEPGCTYNLENFKIVNKGNLALKYKIIISDIQGDVKLNDAIIWDIADSENFLDFDTEYPLAPGAESAITISGHMKETAGNEYMGLSIEGISITVLAAQDTVESDSIGNQYDKNAEYATNVTAKDQMQKALNAGENVVLTEDIATNAYVYPSADTVVSLDLNGKTVSEPADENGDGMFCVQRGTLVLNGTGTVNGTGNNDWNMAVWASGGNVVINDGYYTSEGATSESDPTHMDLIYAGGGNGGNIEINGGTFKCATPQWTLNCYDKDYTAGTASIVVKGGTFFEYDPSNSLTEPAGNAVSYVADGYTVVSEVKSDGTWYTVVQE